MSQAESGYDIIIIGAGIAGLVTANRAAELGRRVAVLETSTDEKYICNSRYAYGTFHINFAGLDMPEDALTAKIDAATAGFARKDLARAVAKDGRRLMQWLKTEGIQLVNLGGYGTNVLSPPWRTGYGLTWENYGADVALQRLEANFLKRQGRVLRGHRANALRQVPGGIEIAVEEAQGAGSTTKKMQVPAVVIADGGFQANHDMLRKSGVSSAPEKLLARNGGTAIGDGLRMALGLGAAVSGGMNNIYGHLHNRDAMSSTKHWPRPVADDLAAAGIVIDATARASPTRAWAASGSPTPSHACPIRSAPRSSSIRRSGTARRAAITRSRLIRWWSRPAARCIAPTRSPNWRKDRAAGTGAERRGRRIQRRA